MHTLPSSIMVCSIGIPYSNFVDYAEDNFITPNRAVENSRWFGRGAELLGLSDRVTSRSYENAYRGVDDRGSSLRRRLTNKNSVPGRDLTFSAPKSVSLLALVQEDKQMIDAHNCAIDRALNYIEQNCIYTRTGQGGSNHQQTRNIVVAVFQHQDSRNLDPNLHSHCVIFNQTQGEDGKWRSMDNRKLYQQKMTLGMVYRHELSQQIIELGHSVNWKENGIFDLANFKLEQLQQFSSRRAEILNVAGVNSSGKAKSYACVSTRNKKEYIKAHDRKALRDFWTIRYNSFGLSTAQTVSRNSAEPEKLKENPKQLSSRIELIDKSIKVLDDRDNKTRFLEHELLREVLIQARGEHKLDLLQRDLKQHHSLIEIEDNQLTTIELYKKERALTLEDDRSNTQAWLGNKEPDVLELATSVLDSESHQQHPDSQFKTEKFILIEVSKHDNKVSQAIENYLQQAELLQNKIIILTDTRAEANELTSNVREGLVRCGKLGDDPIRSVRLQRKDLDRKDLGKTESYQVGDMIKFNRQSKNFSNQHLYKVLGIDENRKVLNLGDRFGSRVFLPLNRHQNREVYEVKRRELRVNEKLRFSRGQYIKGKQVPKGQPFIITKIKDKQRITIEINGKKTIVKSSELLHAEYNYSDTLKERQGRKIDSCIYFPSAAKSNRLFKQDIYDVADLTKGRLTIYTLDNFRNQDRPLQLKMELFKQTHIEPINTFKGIDDTLFELASSAKYIVLNEGQRHESVNQMEEFDLDEARNGGLLDKMIYDSPDGVTIEKDPQNLSIYYDGRTVEFDQDYNVKQNELTEREIHQLNQKTQAIKQQSLERNQALQIQQNQNIDLSR